MAENKDKLIDDSTVLAGTEECKKEVPWAELPSLPLEIIYSFLQREDQVNMSLVCSKWSVGYGSPSVWKNFEFFLTGSKISSNYQTLMKFAHKYSSSFRHVEITCLIYRNKRTYYTWSRHLIEFLKVLTRNSQLTSVKFEHLRNCLQHINSSTTCEAIANFLESQHHLKMVEFFNCYFPYNEGVEILKILAENGRKSLNHILVQRFFVDETRDGQQVSNAEGKLPRIANFPSVTTIVTDYSLIFEYLFASHYGGIQEFEKSQTTHVLSNLGLYYSCETEELQSNLLRGLTSDNWRFLKKLCPGLQVELIIRCEEESREQMEFLFVPNMPVAKLEYWYMTPSEEIEIKPFFDHLFSCNIHKSLVTFQLRCASLIRDFDPVLIKFLNSCTKLKSLAILVVDPHIGIELMKSWLERRPKSLENVCIGDIDMDVKRDFPLLEKAFEEFAPRLESKGLKVHLSDFH